MDMYREALEKQERSPDVLTDLIVLVIAGSAQGISTLTSEHFAGWIRDQYSAARGQSCGGALTILPVLTHGDHIDPEDLDADIKVVQDRLNKMASPGGCACASQLV